MHLENHVKFTKKIHLGVIKCWNLIYFTVKKKVFQKTSGFSMAQFCITLTRPRVVVKTVRSRFLSCIQHFKSSFSAKVPGSTLVQYVEHRDYKYILRETRIAGGFIWAMQLKIDQFCFSDLPPAKMLHA